MLKWKYSGTHDLILLSVSSFVEFVKSKFIHNFLLKTFNLIPRIVYANRVLILKKTIHRLGKGNPLNKGIFPCQSRD